MLRWIRFLVVLAILLGPPAFRLVNGTAHATVSHWSSCPRINQASICNVETPSLPDEFEDEKEAKPGVRPTSTVITPLAGHAHASGYAAGTLVTIRT